jgi:hypothetical protein
MPMLRRILNIALMVLTGFLGLSGLAGGIGLFFGLNTPPAEMLAGSVFHDYTLPALSLFFLVGGGALLALVLLLRKSRYALLVAIAAALIILVFELVEVMVIGSPPGAAFPLQVLYSGTGILIAAGAMAVWFLDLRA